MNAAQSLGTLSVAVVAICACAGGASTAPRAHSIPAASPPQEPTALPCDPCREPPRLSWDGRYTTVESACGSTIELYRRAIPGGASALVMVCDTPCVDTTVAPGRVYAYAVAAPGSGVISAEAYVDTPADDPPEAE